MLIDKELLQRIAQDDPTLERERVYLAHQKLSDEDAVALAQALRTNILLRWIDLTGNRISDTGARALAEVLETNTSVRSVARLAMRFGHPCPRNALA